MNITDEEIASLKATTSEAEWNATCLAIKTARDGAFPPDWFPKIIQSGMMRSIVEGFGGCADIKIIGIR